MYKLLCLDLDGTLFNNEFYVSEENKKALKKCLDNNIMVSLVSGRSHIDLAYLIKDLGLEDCPHVGINGSVAFHLKDGIFGENTIKGETYKDIVGKLIENNNCFCIFENDYCIWQKDRGIPKGMRTFLPYCEIKKGDTLKNKSTYKISVHLQDWENKEDIINFIDDSKLDYCEAGNRFFDISNKGVSKFSGIEYIINKYGINKDEIVAIGDNENDIKMIEGVGLGVAMKNAVKPLKEAANLVIDYTNEEDGVARFIKEYIL